LKINVHNRQRKIRVRLPWLLRLAAAALPVCARHSADGRFALRALDEVEVAIVSDRVIASVHERFMGIPGPTDVITFDHGEIVMSAETAAAYATRYGVSVEMELALYTVHGLLHLNGYGDTSARDAARMRKTQNRILQACLAQLPPA
jgi:probable rRNA maturation factor